MQYLNVQALAGTPHGLAAGIFEPIFVPFFFFLLFDLFYIGSKRARVRM